MTFTLMRRRSEKEKEEDIWRRKIFGKGKYLLVEKKNGDRYMSHILHIFFHIEGIFFTDPP